MERSRATAAPPLSSCAAGEKPASLPKTPAPTAAPPPASPLAPKSPPPHPPVVHDGSHTLSAVQSLAYIIVVAIFTVTFSLQPFRIPSASMEPTLLVGDFLLVDKREPAPANHLSPFPASAIRRGDIVVFYYPVDPSIHLVKRVIGLPGDRLRMRNGRVYINGTPLDEPYAIYTRGPEDAFRDNFPRLQSTDPDVDSRWWMQMQHLVDRGELRIPSGHYFVLGDNRNDSEDSRYWGLVPRAAIVGEPFLVYFSLRDSTGDPTLLRDSRPGQPNPNQPRRTLTDLVADLARWDRTLHIIR